MTRFSSLALPVVAFVAATFTIFATRIADAQSCSNPCTYYRCQWRSYTGTCPSPPSTEPSTGADFWFIPQDCFKSAGTSALTPLYQGQSCWPNSDVGQPYNAGHCADGQFVVGSPASCYTPACLAVASCTSEGEPSYCDGLDAAGSTLIDEGCGDGEFSCKRRDADEFPVRLSAGGRVEIEPVVAFNASIPGVPASTFGYSLRYGSHHGRSPAKGAYPGTPEIKMEDQETHFVGFGFLDSYSDRIFKRGTQYVWVSDRNILTFDPAGGSQFKTPGNRYLLVDQGVGASPRLIVTSSSPHELRQRWTFKTFTYQPGGIAPAPEYYLVDSYKVNTDTAGSGGYGWTITRLGTDGRIDKVIDTLSRELRFSYQTVYNRFWRVSQIKFASNPADSGTVVASLFYTANNSLERISYAENRYTRFRYDTSGTAMAWCPRCAHLLTEVIVPFSSGTPPAPGSPATSSELIVEGHEYEYYVASDGVKAYRVRRSFGPPRSWFYNWPSFGPNGSVTQLDLHQPQLSGGIPVACGGGCSTGHGCYPSAKGGDDKCYIATTFTLDTTNRNMTGSTGVSGGSYRYGSGQGPTRDADSAGRKTTYARDPNGDVTCMVHGDDDDSALSGGSCVGPAGSQTVSVTYGGACFGVPASVASAAKSTPSILGAGNHVDTECFDSHGLTIATKSSGFTRDINGMQTNLTRVGTRTFDTLGRVTSEAGPLDNAVAKDVVSTSYYTTFDPTWPYNLGNVYQVTRYVGTDASSIALTTTYSEYDLFGVPHLVTHPNGDTVRYTPSVDRTVWETQASGIAAPSSIRLNYNGTVKFVLDEDSTCVTYDYFNDSTSPAKYVGAPTKIRRGTTDGTCGVLPIPVNSGEVEIRSYINGERDRLASVTRKTNGGVEFTYSGFTYDVDRRVTNASTINSSSTFTFAFTDVLPSGVAAPEGPGAGTWKTTTTADDFGRPTSLARFLDAANKQTYTYGYATPFTPRPTQLERGYNGSSTAITTFVYDDFGGLIETIVPESGPPSAAAPTRYEYDPAGRMLKKRVGVGTALVRTSSYSYDSLGRTTSVDHDTEHPVDCASAPVGTPIDDEEYKYDSCSLPDVPPGFSCANALGRSTIARAVLQCGTSGQTIKRGRWYTYDAAGRVSAVAYATVTGSTVGWPATMYYSYTAASRMSQYTSPTNYQWGTHYDFDPNNGRISAMKTTGPGGSPIASDMTYRSFGPLTSLKTASSQVAGGSERTLQLSITYRSDDSINELAWRYNHSGGPFVAPINIISQTIGYAPGGLIKTRTDAADIASSRFYGYDALLRMTCEARGSGSTQPTVSDCATSATRLAGLFTYGDGQSATSPPDVRLTSFLRSDNPTGGACSSTNRCYLSPSTETSTYASGSAQLQGITRTGSSLVVAHDALGRRSYDYDNFDPTRSRRDYTYLPGGQLGTISGRTPGNAPYTVTMRYDERGRPIVVSSTIGDSYELFWDDVDRLISVQITPIGPRGTAPQILSIRWHYHYVGTTLVAATREIEKEDFSVLVKRFWAATDERGLIYRMLDSQGATHWQARWDATGWQTLIGTPQPEMWVPFGLQEQLLIARTRVYVITSSTYQEGTEAYASGTGGTWVRPPIVLNQRRALDPLLGAFLQADGSDHLGRMDPEAYAYGPVISRCSRMSLVILEYSGCRYMSLLGCSRRFGAGFSRPGRAFSKRFETDMPGEINQGCSQLGRAHGRKDAPLGLRNGNHHAFVGGCDIVGHIIERDFLIDFLLAMNTAQGSQGHCQHIVGHQGQTKSEQGRLGIAQGVDCRVKICLDVLEGGLKRPTLVVKVSDLSGWRRLTWHIRQDIEERLAISGRLFEFESQTPAGMALALGIDQANALFSDASRREAPLRPKRTDDLKGQPLMFTDDEKGTLIVEGREKLAGAEVAIGYPQITCLGCPKDALEQRALLGMAIFAGHHIGDQTIIRLVHHQGLAGQSRPRRLTQGFKAALRRFETIAVNDFDAIPSEPGLAYATDLLDQGRKRRRTVADQL